MAKHYKLSDARVETQSARDRHLALLRDVRRHCVTANPAKDGVLYLLAVPMIYAAWEGYFKLVCSLCIKRKCETTRRAKLYANGYSTLWLQKEPFVQSFMQSLINGMQPGKAVRASTAQYDALRNFSGNIAGWLERPVDHTLDFETLVMTYSNVNKDVVAINAGAIGLGLAGVTLGKLDELLGWRNNVAHGGLMTYPTEAETVDFFDYAERLISTFDAAIQRWLPTT